MGRYNGASKRSQQRTGVLSCVIRLIRRLSQLPIGASDNRSYRKSEATTQAVFTALGNLRYRASGLRVTTKIRRLRVAPHHHRRRVEGSPVRLPMSSTCRLTRSCPNGQADSVGIGVVGVVALIHVLVELIATTSGASPSGAPCRVVRTVPLREQWQPTSCRRREPVSTPLDAAPDRWPLVGVDRPPCEHGVDRRPDVSGRHR